MGGELFEDHDYIVRATTKDGTVRAFAARTTQMVQAAHETHKTSPVASAALGRVLTAAAMLSQDSKGEKDMLTIQVKAEGPLGGIIAVADHEANVKGYLHNPGVELPLTESGKIDVSGGVGREGYINVVRDMGLKEPYGGYVNLISGEIGDDLAYYFASSEQIPSVVALGVLVSADANISQAGGLLIQLMPGADEKTVSVIEEKISSLPPVTSLLSQGKSPEDILEMILGDLGLEMYNRHPCLYKCNCSRDRMERNLISLGKAELVEMIDSGEDAELECHFCNSKYVFTTEQLAGLVGEQT